MSQTELKIRVKEEPNSNAVTFLIAGGKAAFDAYTQKPDENERLKLVLDLTADERITQQINNSLNNLKEQLCEEHGVVVDDEHVWTPLNTEKSFFYSNWNPKHNQPTYVNEAKQEVSKPLQIKQGAILNYKVRVKAYLGQNESGDNSINLTTYPSAVILIQQGDAVKNLADEFDF